MLKDTKYTIFLCSLTFLLGVLISPAGGQTRIEIVPMITATHEYDDNIDLEDANKKSDYITTISPGISVKIATDKNGIDFNYSPSWVKYHDSKNNDTTRHSGTFHLWHAFSQYLRFDLSDTYSRTEEPDEEIFVDRDIQTVRHTRDIYERNSISTNLDYQFGPRDHISMGYSHELLENDDPTLDDSTEQGPFCALSYWFDIRNGLTLNYSFSTVEYDREEGSPSGTDYDSHKASATYIHNFNQHTSFNINYQFSARNFQDDTETDYRVHSCNVGFDHSFSEYTSISAHVGGYLPIDAYDSEGLEMDYGASLNRRFQHGNISFGVVSGWDEGDLEAEERDFTEYWDFNSSFNYLIWKDLSSFGGLSHRTNKDHYGPDDETYEGHCGLTWSFLRWYHVSLRYAYQNRQSDNPDDEYTNNSIVFTLSGSRPFHWIYSDGRLTTTVFD